jgi:hypothetical protein
MSIPFLVANFNNFNNQPKNWYRPSSSTGEYLSGSTGGTLLSGTAAYDNDTSATLDTDTANGGATVMANSTNGTRTYAGTFDGFGSGTFTGTLRVYAYLSAQDDGGGSCTCELLYSIDGSTYISLASISSNADAVSAAAAEYTVALTSQNLANLKVRMTCDGYRVGISPDIFLGDSTGTIYDIVFA